MRSSLQGWGLMNIERLKNEKWKEVKNCVNSKNFNLIVNNIYYYGTGDYEICHIIQRLVDFIRMLDYNST